MRKRAALTAVVGLVLALAPPALAQEGDTSNGVLLIMDASGSMGRVDDRGVRLIDGAKDALTTLVSAVPEGAPIGLRVYGHRVAEPDEAGGCADTELVVPVGPLRRDEMNEAIGSFDALGYTPIGASLQAAAEDLGGAGTIVLVSDGEDTCAPPDPCEIAAELLAAGFDLRVESIGFFVDDEVARGQLQCIAATTGGSYREVGNVESLAAEIGVLVGQSIPEVGRFHLPLLGGSTVSTATPAPLRALDTSNAAWAAFDGAYNSRLEPNTTQWFSIDVEAGHGLLVSGSPEPLDADPNGTVEISILDRDGNDARRAAPRRGVAEVAVSDVIATGASTSGVWLGSGNHTDFLPWAQLDPDEVPSLEAQGYDEQRYNHEWLVAMLAPLEDPPPAGPYAVGLTWHSDEVGGQMGVGWSLIVTAQPVERYGQVYERLDGGPDAASATRLAAPGQSRQFDPFFFPPGEYVEGVRSYHVGAVSSGTTSWYHQPMEFDEALVVEALVVDANGQPVEDGSLDLEIFDRDMTSIGSASPVTSALDPTGRGILAAVSMVDDASGEPPPSSDDGAWLAITWTSPSDAPVDARMIVDVTARYPNSSAPNPTPRQPEAETDLADNAEQPAESTENPVAGEQSQSTAAEEPSGSNGPSGFLIAAVLAGLAGAVFTIAYALRRRQADALEEPTT